MEKGGKEQGREGRGGGVLKVLLPKSWILRRGESSMVLKWGQGGELQSRHRVIRRRNGVRERRRGGGSGGGGGGGGGVGAISRAMEEGRARLSPSVGMRTGERERERDVIGWRKVERSWWRREKDEAVWVWTQSGWEKTAKGNHLASQRGDETRWESETVNEWADGCVTWWHDAVVGLTYRERSIDRTVAGTTLYYNQCPPKS